MTVSRSTQDDYSMSRRRTHKIDVKRWRTQKMTVTGGEHTRCLEQEENTQDRCEHEENTHNDFEQENTHI